MHVASNPVGANPSFQFPGNYTSVDGKAATTSVASSTGTITGTGSGIADLLMGTVDTASVGLAAGSFNEVANYHALYFQDDFRATDKLTVNLGLRYEYELGLREENNQLTVGFDKNVSYTIRYDPSRDDGAVHMAVWRMPGRMAIRFTRQIRATRSFHRGLAWRMSSAKARCSRLVLACSTHLRPYPPSMPATPSRALPIRRGLVATSRARCRLPSLEMDPMYFSMLHSRADWSSRPVTRLACLQDCFRARRSP